MADLRPDTARVHVPDEPASVRATTDEHHTLSSACTRQEVHKHQRLDALPLAMSLQLRQRVSLLQTDNFNATGRSAHSGDLTIWRHGERGDTVFCRVDLGSVRWGEQGRFEDWRRGGNLPQDEGRVERGGEELTAVGWGEGTARDGHGVRRQDGQGVSGRYWDEHVFGYC